MAGPLIRGAGPGRGVRTTAGPKGRVIVSGAAPVNWICAAAQSAWLPFGVSAPLRTCRIRVWWPLQWNVHGHRAVARAQKTAFPQQRVVGVDAKLDLAGARVGIVVDADLRGEALGAALEVDIEHAGRVRAEAGGEALPADRQRPAADRLVGRGHAPALLGLGQVQSGEGDGAGRQRRGAGEQCAKGQKVEQVPRGHQFFHRGLGEDVAGPERRVCGARNGGAQQRRGTFWGEDDGMR